MKSPVLLCPALMMRTLGASSELLKKIKLGTLENVGSGEVELPQQEMQTTSAWLTATPPDGVLVNDDTSRSCNVGWLHSAMNAVLVKGAPDVVLARSGRTVHVPAERSMPVEERVVRQSVRYDEPVEKASAART